MANKYYQSELAYLREMGREFGRKHPALGGMLAERGGDPDVERLLEGFAFLTARIRERLDASVPELVEGLCELLAPHYLSSRPAATVVQFAPQGRGVRSRLLIPRGTELATAPVEGTRCQFRTTADVTLLPLSITEVALDTPSANRPVLRVNFHDDDAGREELAQLGSLRLFLHGEYSQTSMVLLWLSRHLRGIELADAKGGAKVRLPLDSFVPAGLDAAEAMLPSSPFSPNGFRLLQEYYALPQRFLFFEVRNLGPALAQVGEQFELRFELERPPALPAPLGRDLVKLYCAPAVNLFEVDAEPIRVSAPEEEHLVRAAGMDPTHMEVHAVREVLGAKASGGARRTYAPFSGFAHDASNRAIYRLRRASSPLDDGLDTFISLSIPRDASAEFEEEVLSMRLTCTNRSLPHALRVGEVNAPAPGSPAQARFSNLLPVSPPVRPPRGGELHWRLLAQLGLNRRSLAQSEALRASLALHNFQSSETPEARSVVRKLESIGALQVEPARHAVQGAPVRGQRTTLELDEAGFAGAGDAFIFGAVLDVLFADHLTLNAFNALRLTLLPSKQEYSWPARSGGRSLL